MAAQLLPLRIAYGTGADIYSVRHGMIDGAEYVWNPTANDGDGGWEEFNGAHWAQYPIELDEQGSSGYYSAAGLAGTVDALTWDVFYNNATPTLGDAPITAVVDSQGANVVGLAGDTDAAKNQRDAAASMQRGKAAGTPTASVIPTDLEATLAYTYAGRSIIFTSGDCYQCAGRIVGYNPTNGVLTLAAPLPMPPSADDDFVIIQRMLTPVTTLTATGLPGTFPPVGLTPTVGPVVSLAFTLPMAGAPANVIQPPAPQSCQNSTPNVALRVLVVNMAGEAVDLSEATGLQLWLLAPNETKIPVPAALVTNGMDGLLEAVTDADTLPQAGTYGIQAQLSFGTFILETRWGYFAALKNVVDA